MNRWKLWRTLFLSALVTILVWIAVPVEPAHADGIVVNTLSDDGTSGNAECSLREAIINANNDNSTSVDCAPGSGADTITFGLSGTILLGAASPLITSTITIDGVGQSVTVSGNSSHRVFQVTPTGTLTVDTLTIANGAADAGAGIYNDGTLTIIDSILSGNVSSGGFYGGGAIFNNSRRTITSISNSTFSNNFSSSPGGGGAIYLLGGTIGSIAGSTFSNNVATATGAGTGGGAISNGGTISSIANSTFSGNSASKTGGAILNYYSTISSIVNSTFSGNSATFSGGAIYNLDGSFGTIANTIIANSPLGGNCVGTAPGTSTSNLTDGGGCWAWTNTLNPASHLGSLADNGGPTETIALLETVLAAGTQAISAVNPAIDTGDAATCDGAPVNSRDQRGYLRPQSGNCDIGAFEANGTPLAVTLGWFLAKQAGESVQIRWQTVAEAGTAGFNLLTQASDGSQIQLNSDLIPSKVIDSVVPSDYSYWASTEATIFYLQEITIDGRRHKMGPFMLGQPSGAVIPPENGGLRPMIWLPMATGE